MRRYNSGSGGKKAKITHQHELGLLTSQFRQPGPILTMYLPTHLVFFFFCPWPLSSYRQSHLLARHIHLTASLYPPASPKHAAKPASFRPPATTQGRNNLKRVQLTYRWRIQVSIINNLTWNHNAHSKGQLQPNKKITHHSTFTSDTVRIQGRVVSINSLKITQSGCVSRPHDGSKPTTYIRQYWKCMSGPK